MFKTILFDVDGTIIDTQYMMTKSLQKTLLEEKQLEIPLEKLHYILGIPGREALKNFTKDDKELEMLLTKWNDNILLFSEHATLFPDIEKVIKTLYTQGVELGVVTSKTREEMKNEFDTFGLTQYFKVQVTASDTSLHKPNPDPIQKALDKLEADKKETVYVGDSLYDMRSAKSCGISFALAQWGALESNAFTEINFSLKKPKDLLNLTDPTPNINTEEENC